ncbi:hypothetical protein ACWEKT_05630 [Nocardia takedensis]
MAADADVSDSLTEYGEVLTPSSVAQFLATRHWTVQMDRKVDQTWVLNGAGVDRPVAVLVPREPRFVDFGKRLREAVETISRAYGLSVPELVEQIAAVNADLFYVRVDQRMADGTISLRQATSLLENIDQMIRTAALAAHNPQSTGRGRAPDFVNEFLNDDVRMGHTKKGSFIITVAARIPESGERRTPMVAAAETAPSFTRQVTTTLAESLDVTRRFAANRGEFADLDHAVDEGLKLQIVQALQEMGSGGGLRALDLSFEWSPTEPQRASVPTRIRLDRDIIDVLPDIERRLQRGATPKRVTVVGPVRELRQYDNDVSEPGGEVVVLAEVDGRVRRITVPLGSADHEWAIVAYRRRLPFTVSGQLIKRNNVWRLDGPIDVDTSFLRFHARSTDADPPPP